MSEVHERLNEIERQLSVVQQFLEVMLLTSPSIGDDDKAQLLAMQRNTEASRLANMAARHKAKLSK